MRSRRDPKKPTFNRRLHTDPLFKRQFERWSERLTGVEGTRPEELSQEHYDFIRTQLMLRRGRDTQSHYERKRIEMTPVLSVPESDTPIDDLHLIFTLPEMQQFWVDWSPPHPPNRTGRRPDWGSAKAGMTMLAMTGHSSHLRDAYNLLTGRNTSYELLVMFQSLERLAMGRAVPSLPGVGAQPVPMQVASEDTVNRLMVRLAEHTIRVASQTRMQLLLSLKEFHPRVGQRWLIDGTDVPAWARQVGTSDPKREAELRRHTPNAGHRMYTRDGSGPGGKSPVGAGDSAKQVLQVGKSWRGYHLVGLMDQATSLWGPLTLFDATMDEAAAIVPLLSQLYRDAESLRADGLTPYELDAREIVGDSAWDEDPWCKLALVDYGIDPIFRLHPNQAAGRKLAIGESRDGTVIGYSKFGHLLCQPHTGKQLHQGGFEAASRDGLRPGESSDERRFRVRAGDSPCGCGRVGLGVRADWSKLLRHPHHPDGRPDLFAHREAALDSLQQVEAGFNSLKTGRKVANGGEERTRIRDDTAVQALIELAALGQAALTVYDQRQRRGGANGFSLHVPESGTVAQGQGTASPAR